MYKYRIWNLSHVNYKLLRIWMCCNKKNLIKVQVSTTNGRRGESRTCHTEMLFLWQQFYHKSLLCTAGRNWVDEHCRKLRHRNNWICDTVGDIVEFWNPGVKASRNFNFCWVTATKEEDRRKHLERKLRLFGRKEKASIFLLSIF